MATSKQVRFDKAKFRKVLMENLLNGKISVTIKTVDLLELLKDEPPKTALEQGKEQ